MIMDTLKQILKYLNIPSLPKKKYIKDDDKNFKTGIAHLKLIDGTTSYAVATYDKDVDKEPRIIKTFSYVPFIDIIDIYIVPSYLDEIDIENSDLNEDSKQKLGWLVDEAKELENDGVNNDVITPNNEYYFDNIHNDQEAKAYIKSYNKKNKINGKIPSTHDSLIMRLSVIYSEINK